MPANLKNKIPTDTIAEAERKRILKTGTGRSYSETKKQAKSKRSVTDSSFVYK